MIVLKTHSNDFSNRGKLPFEGFICKEQNTYKMPIGVYEQNLTILTNAALTNDGNSIVDLTKFAYII